MYFYSFYNTIYFITVLYIVYYNINRQKNRNIKLY